MWVDIFYLLFSLTWKDMLQFMCLYFENEIYEYERDEDEWVEDPESQLEKMGQ